MPTGLDLRPSARGTKFYGRALVEQRRADALAADKERDNIRQDAAQAATERHQKLQDDIAKEHLAMEKTKASLEMEIKLRDLRQEREQLDAFASAQRRVADLKPDDPLLQAKVAQIQADHPVLFAGKGTHFAQALGGMVTELFAQQKALDAAKVAKVKAADEFTLKTGIPVPLDKNGQPDIAAAAKAKADAAKALTAGMVPSTYTDPTTGVTMKAPPDAQKDIHAQQKLFMDDYHAIERERVGAAKLMKGIKPGAPIPDEIKLLDSRRTQALKNLQSVGINLSPDAVAAPVVPVTPGEPVSTPTGEGVAAPVTATPAPVDNIALAKQALDDPAASALHKSAARKILGYLDETPAPTQ
jgi:hypothetical protein